MCISRLQGFYVGRSPAAGSLKIGPPPGKARLTELDGEEICSSLSKLINVGLLLRPPQTTRRALIQRKPATD
jgi:hypothetical protein